MGTDLSNTALQQRSDEFSLEVRHWLQNLAITTPGLLVTKVAPDTLRLEKDWKLRLDIILKTLYQAIQNTEHLPDTRLEAGKSILLWEDSWRTQQELVQSRIRAQLGLSLRIPARVTFIQKIDRPTTLHFLQENHMQAPVLSKYSYGLFLPKRYDRFLKKDTILATKMTDTLLVAVATFAHPRTFLREGRPHRSYELVRFASLKNTTVVGGLGKLLQHFVQHHHPDDIMTYADLEWSSGASYEKLGFEAHETTPPLSFWVDPHSSVRYYPHRLPEGISETSAPFSGLIRIHNAGSRKFVRKISTNT